MATTTYPKSYVLDRIEARTQSLKARQRVIEGEQIEFAEQMGEAVTSWADRFAGDITKLRSRQVFNLEDAKRLKDAAASAGGLLPGDASLTRYNQEPTPEQKLAQRKRDVYFLDQEYDKLTQELDAIDHVRAYLQGTPVEEFTLTQLKTLGLLDFVKFDLQRAKEAK